MQPPTTVWLKNSLKKWHRTKLAPKIKLTQYKNVKIFLTKPIDKSRSFAYTISVRTEVLAD